MSRHSEDIIYHITLGLLRAVALLPLSVLYLFADIIFVLVYHVVRYRRRMVRGNLAKCFPDKSPRELQDIERRFYRNFADYVVETIKLLHISDKEMMRRFTFSGLDTVHETMDNGRTIVAFFSHTGNWEWVPCITLHCHEQSEAGDVFCQIYRPLRNRVFDRLMLHIRSRFGSVSIPKATTLRRFLEMRRAGIVSMTGFMSDQKPSHGDAVHIIDFLEQPTAVITGTATLAHRLGTAVVYFDISKPRRGHYHLNIVPMCEDASNVDPLSLTDNYFALLENTIRREPAIWLWTHNRWKNGTGAPRQSAPATLGYPSAAATSDSSCK